MLQYLDDTQVNWKTGMHPFIGISMGGGVYGLNIVSQINSAGFLTLFNF